MKKKSCENWLSRFKLMAFSVKLNKNQINVEHLALIFSDFNIYGDRLIILTVTLPSVNI